MEGWYSDILARSGIQGVSLLLACTHSPVAAVQVALDVLARKVYQCYETLRQQSACRFNPSGPTARRHYGCASVTQHDHCAANAAPLAEVVAERTWEVQMIQCTKDIYNKFSEVRHACSLRRRFFLEATCV